MRTSVAAVSAIAGREARIFASYRARVGSRLITIFLSLALFHFLSQLIEVGQFTHRSYFAFVVVGMVILEIVESSFQMTGQLYQELIAGTFERMAVSPFGPVGCILSLMIFPVLLTFTYCLATLAFAIGIFGLRLHWQTAGAGVPIALMAAVSFAPVSVAFCAATVAFKQQTGSAYVITAVSFLSGLYFPVALLPGWVRWASEIQPVTPSVDLLRHAVVGLPLTGTVTGDLLRIVLFTVVLLPLSIVVLQMALALGRRRGTLMEY